MPQHDFLDLKMGLIHQYSMVIEKSRLADFKKFGWLDFSDIGLTTENIASCLLYGEIKEHETLVFNRPILLRDIVKDTLIGRRILDVSTHLGTYGMGGPGFFGILLDNSEFLTYAVWGAGTYALVDERAVECSLDFYESYRPWISFFGNEGTWNELTDYIAGSHIVDYLFDDSSCTFFLKKEKSITLRFVKNDRRIPRRLEKDAYAKGIITDYILFQHKNATLIV